MTTFTILSQAVQTKLRTLDAMAGVSLVQEDTQDLEIEIAKAEGEIGMMVLLGTPGYANEDGTLSDVINAKISFEILVREVPLLWRIDENENAIRCADLGQAIGPALQGLVVNGFEPLRVLSGKPLGSFVEKQNNDGEPTVFQDFIVSVETMQIFDASN